MVNIYIQGQLIDQFNDENVEVVSQVLDIQDITKVKGDYSKTFTVPASKTNNKIFKHWYNASVDSGFDARTKVDGKIDIDGIPFKTGKFLLRSAKIEDGIITSYTINFFGNFTSFKDIIGKDKISDLVNPSTGINYLDTYNFTRNGDNVRDRLLVDDLNPFPEVIYTPSGRDKLFYNSDFSIEGSALNANDSQSLQYRSQNINIAWSGLSGGGTPANKAGGLVWNKLTPSLRLDTIIDAIESRYTKANGYSGDIVFSRDFFDTSEFKRLYMYLSAIPDLESGTTNGQSNFNRVNWTSDGSPQNYINISTDTFTDTSWSEGDNWYFKLTCEQLQEMNGYITARLFRGDDTLYGSYSGFASYTTENGGPESNPFEVEINSIVYSDALDDLSGWYWDISNEVGGELDIIFEHKKNSGTTYSAEGVEGGSGAPAGTAPYVISDHVPDIEVMEFLKGIFQMFKLVIVPQEDGTLYVNTIDSYYEQGAEYEVSKYLDRSSLEVTRGDIISSIDLKFKESNTLIAKTFREQFNRGYGDSKIRFEDEFGDLLEGEKIEINLPFEQVQFDRLTDNAPDVNVSQTNIASMYFVNYVGLGDEGLETYETVQSGCVLHYAFQQSNNTKSLLFRNASTTSLPSIWEEISEPIYMPSHHIDINNPFASLMFDKEISNYTENTVNNTLYFNRIDDYVQDVIDISRRGYKYTAKLPTIVAANLGLNDVLVIDGVRMRINKFSYNILTGLTKLDLWNSNYTQLTQTGGRTPNLLQISYLGDTFTFALENADLYTITKTSLGFGTTWATTGTSFQSSRGVQRHNRVNITVDANNSNINRPRQMKINLTAPDGKVTNIIIAQNEE